MQGDDVEKWKRFVELRRPAQMKKWTEEAGLREDKVMGKGAISADDDKVVGLGRGADPFRLPRKSCGVRLVDDESAPTWSRFYPGEHATGHLD